MDPVGYQNWKHGYETKESKQFGYPVDFERALKPHDWGPYPV